MDIHQTRTESKQYEMKAKMDTHQEKMEAATYSTWWEFEGIIKHQVEEVLSRVDKKMQGPHKKLTEKTEKKQVGLQPIKTSPAGTTGHREDGGKFP